VGCLIWVNFCIFVIEVELFVVLGEYCDVYFWLFYFLVVFWDVLCDFVGVVLRVEDIFYELVDYLLFVLFGCDFCEM